MSSDLAFAPMPQPWSIVVATGADGRPLRLLRIGAKEVAVADIESVAVETVVSRDSQGLRLIAVVFAITSLVLLAGVAQFGWRPRFLIGSTFLAALALAGVFDIRSLGAIVYRRMHIRTRRGATLLFASADPLQIAALAFALGVDLPPSALPRSADKNRATGALQVE